MSNATLLDTDMSTWAPGTRHYRCDDGRHFAVTVDPGFLPDVHAEQVNRLLDTIGVAPSGSGVHNVVRQPTVVLACDQDGAASDLTPIQRCAPGTSHADALASMGYRVT